MRDRLSGRYTARQVTSRGHGESHRDAGRRDRLAAVGRRSVSCLLESAGSVCASRKSNPGCALSEVSGRVNSDAAPTAASKHLEAFLEMLAAERGSAPLTLAAYHHDLSDLLK